MENTGYEKPEMEIIETDEEVYGLVVGSDNGGDKPGEWGQIF